MDKKENTYGKMFTYGEMENLAHLSADLMEKLREARNATGDSERFNGSADVIMFLVGKAMELEKRLGGVNEDEGDYDYFEELDKFEKEILDEVK